MKRTYAIAILLTVASVAQGAILLRQSTAVTIRIGPFVDATDGYTREKSLTVTGWNTGHAGAVSLVKGATLSTLTITASGGSNDAAHLGQGMYSLELTAANTDTVGPLTIDVNDPNARSVTHDYEVVSADWYDLQTGAASFMTTATTRDAVRYSLEAAVDNDPNAGSISKLVQDGLTSHTPQSGDTYTYLGTFADANTPDTLRATVRKVDNGTDRGDPTLLANAPTVNPDGTMVAEDMDTLLALIGSAATGTIGGDIAALLTWLKMIMAAMP